MCLTLFNVASLPRHLRGHSFSALRQDIHPPPDPERDDADESCPPAESARPGTADTRAALREPSRPL